MDDAIYPPLKKKEIIMDKKQFKILITCLLIIDASLNKEKETHDNLLIEFIKDIKKSSEFQEYKKDS